MENSQLHLKAPLNPQLVRSKLYSLQVVPKGNMYIKEKRQRYGSQFYSTEFYM